MKKLIKKYLNKSAKIIFRWAYNLPSFSRNTEGRAFLRTDNIGDYLLFRNLLPFIKQSEKYRNEKIILIGNSIWKELAEHFDKDFVDIFFWIDMVRYQQDRIYKLKILWQLNQLKITELINTVHSRTLQINELANFINAQLKTTCAGDAINLSQILHIKSEKLFNEIVPSLSNFNFEFFRNKTFIEHLINEKIELNKPCFNSIKKEIKPLQIIIFPSAQSAQRRWNVAHFSDLINALNMAFPALVFLVLGSKADIDLGEKILKKCNNPLVIKNLCGKTSLSELVQIIANSRLVISNETSSVHIAAAVETPTICISNGNHFGRFNPYPLSMNCPINYFYPDERFYKKENWNDLVQKYQYPSDLNINEIKSEIILQKIISILMDENN